MIGILITTILAFVFSVILVNLHVLLDDKTGEVNELLPGYNCGACGYKGCADLANAIASDPSLYVKCRVLKGEGLIKMQEYIKKIEK